MKPSLFLLALACSMPPPACARQVAERTPEQTLRSTIDKVMSAIRSDPGARAGDPERTLEIVRRDFLPSTDFMLTTQYAVGSAWARATPAQREALFREFQTLLARTYAIQLTQIQQENTQFRYASATRSAANATDAVVKTSVVTGADTMPIDYRMHKTSAGWKIYDINMMGAWMIQVYRQQFAARLATEGIDGLIRYLAAHNRGP
ncbi:ABC transporter substrate-binding protein [Massilia sp. NEAU-DD11]|uniref:ABC transporter substrate-binding protein n=1 Tax=Massilia cellulosiltytica TaxID=2683234 RepID=A0A7X3K6Z7_9BURK|nr:ABC transporter substrate-binding protein [Telluria cellulosilytica]MVW59750.1 ABC transporter substrate-binding protein [Telluria cellulosilytica]